MSPDISIVATGAADALAVWIPPPSSCSAIATCQSAHGPAGSFLGGFRMPAPRRYPRVL